MKALLLNLDKELYDDIKKDNENVTQYIRDVLKSDIEEKKEMERLKENKEALRKLVDADFF